MSEPWGYKWEAQSIRMGNSAVTKDLSKGQNSRAMLVKRVFFKTLIRLRPILSLLLGLSAGLPSDQDCGGKSLERFANYGQ